MSCLRAAEGTDSFVASPAGLFDISISLVSARLLGRLYEFGE